MDGMDGMDGMDKSKRVERHGFSATSWSLHAKRSARPSVRSMNMASG
jgi:hypothetical protein